MGARGPGHFVAPWGVPVTGESVTGEARSAESPSAEALSSHPRSTPRAGWPRRWVTILCVAVLVLVAGAAVAWPTSAAAARHSVVLRVDAAPWVCSSGSAPIRRVSDGVDGQPGYASLAVISPGMRCRLRIFVANTGSLPVTVDRVNFELFGERAAINVDAIQLDGAFSTIRPSTSTHSADGDVRADADADAHFVFAGGLALAPGQTRLVTLTVVYKTRAPGARSAQDPRSWTFRSRSTSPPWASRTR